MKYAINSVAVTILSALVGFISCIVLLQGKAAAFPITPWTSKSTKTSAISSSTTRYGIHGSVLFARSDPSSRTVATAALVVPKEALELQQKIRRLCADQSKADRETLIEGLAQELNALNPTKNPAFSPLLAGKWKMLYSTVSGPSSGRLGPFVGDVFQDIRPDEQRIINMLELGPSWALRGALEADVEVLDGDNWAIIFDVVYNKFAGIQVQEKKFDRIITERRIWNMTYLDEDFRVFYGRQEGTSAEEGFIFVLERA